MKKNILLVFGIIILLYFDSSYSAIIANEGGEQTNEFLGTISSLFSQKVFLNLLFALLTIFLTFFISKLTRDKLFNYLEKNISEDDSGIEVVGVITRTVNIIILISGFSIALGILGVDMTIFVGGIGFGIGFTLKTFLTNFVAGIIMITQNTYHNGDLIKIDGETGNIIKINSLFTSIQKIDGVIFFVPNIKFIEEKVSNYHSNDKRRIDIEVLVDYKTDIHKAKTIIYKVIEKFPNILKAPDVEILVDKLDDSGILLNVRFWIPSKEKYFQIKSNIIETINLAFSQYGIVIPYPHIQIVNLEK